MPRVGRGPHLDERPGRRKAACAACVVRPFARIKLCRAHLMAITSFGERKTLL